MAGLKKAASELRVQLAPLADVRVVEQIVEDAYCVYTSRMGKLPGPMFDDYSQRVEEGVVWVLEEGTTTVGIVVLLPKSDHLLLDNIAIAPARQGLVSVGGCLHLQKQKRCVEVIAKYVSTHTRP